MPCADWAILKKLGQEVNDEAEEEPGITHSAAQGSASGTQIPRPALHTMPEWKRRVAAQRAESTQRTASIMSEASTQEEAARARLAKIKARAQRELSRAASAAVIEEQQEKRRLLKARVRAETNALIGKDVTERVREIPEIDENEVRSLSMLFNQHLKQFDRDSRNFFQLFKSMDIDGSKRIGFGELEHMVRSKLMIPEKKIDAQKLLGLWKRLDENESGFIDAGELSRFLRIGKLKEPTPAQKARARLQAERERKMAMVRKESDKLLEKDVAARVGEVQPASEM